MTSRLITDAFPQVKKTTERPSKDDQRRGSPRLQKTDAVASASANEKAAELEMLRQFDLKWEYGPCVGITRLERWERAKKHGLNPSQAVKDLILEHLDNEIYTQCVWNDYNI